MRLSSCRRARSLTFGFRRSHSRIMSGCGSRTMALAFLRKPRTECSSCSSGFIVQANMKGPELALPLCAKQSREWGERPAWNRRPARGAGFGCYYRGNEVSISKELPDRKVGPKKRTDYEHDQEAACWFLRTWFRRPSVRARRPGEHAEWGVLHWESRDAEQRNGRGSK